VRLFGAYTPPGTFGGVVASEWSPADLSRCDASGALFWRYASDGDPSNASWVQGSPSDPTGLAYVYSTSLTETTFWHSTTLDAYMTLDIPFDSADINVASAQPGKDIVGPTNGNDNNWTTVHLMDIPAPWNDTSTFFSYAGKFHPNLPANAAADCPPKGGNLAASEVVPFSFVSNAFSFGTLFQPGRIDTYIPRLFRMCIYDD
jgi:hypothetical protein